MRKALEDPAHPLVKAGQAAKEVVEDVRIKVLPQIARIAQRSNDEQIKSCHRRISSLAHQAQDLTTTLWARLSPGEFGNANAPLHALDLASPVFTGLVAGCLALPGLYESLTELVQSVRADLAVERAAKTTTQEPGPINKPKKEEQSMTSLFKEFEKDLDRVRKGVAALREKVFIGHGRSHVWREVKDFIQDCLHLQWDEFNREPTPGITTKERLETMLDEAIFAVIIMTAEDERADKTKQARANVIHEVGLFQGRLGFKRAIVLLEEGCEEFSNIEGLGQIRFPAGNVKSQFEELRRVLEREKLL